MDFNQDRFFKAVASRRIPRIRVAGIVVDEGSVLVQRPADEPNSCFAFIGGEYQLGDTFESRLRKEFEEETNARIAGCEYLLCVENHFEYKGNVIQQAEHFFRVELNRRDVSSRELHLEHHWLPICCKKQSEALDPTARMFGKEVNGAARGQCLNFGFGRKREVQRERIE